MSKSVPKIGIKDVPAGRGFPHTNSGVCRPKKRITPEKRILKREADTSVVKNKTTYTRNSAKLLSHMLSNVRGYQCISKEAAAEKPPSKYIMPQKQSRALSAASSLTPLSATSEASQLGEKFLQLAIIGAALF